jgi:hypothetical protein
MERAVEDGRLHLLMAQAMVNARVPSSPFEYILP